jgi:hypothetical protein
MAWPICHNLVGAEQHATIITHGSRTEEVAKKPLTLLLLTDETVGMNMHYCCRSQRNVTARLHRVLQLGLCHLVYGGYTLMFMCVPL